MPDQAPVENPPARQIGRHSEEPKPQKDNPPATEHHSLGAEAALPAPSPEDERKAKARK